MGNERSDKKDQDDQYPIIPPNEISDAYETYPLKGDLMHVANKNLKKARAQAEGETEREKRYHEAGWQIAIETPQGIVGLWSCWLKDRFFLGYPKSVLQPSIERTDDLIMRVLGVEKGKPVRQVNAIAVNDWDFEDPYFKDSDKPLEQNKAGQVVAYKDVGPRLWARFYGPQEPTGGRVWVDSSNFHSNGFHFEYLRGDKVEQVYYGHDQSNSIFTFPFDQHSQYAPEGPTSDPEAVQKYREKFIQLAAEIAFIMGGPRAINLDFGIDDKGVTLVPEDLYREFYEDIEWIRGGPGIRKGWGNELVKAKKGDSTIVLKSGNSIVPWSTLLHAPISSLRSSEALADFIREDALFF